MVRVGFKGLVVVACACAFACGSQSSKANGTAAADGGPHAPIATIDAGPDASTGPDTRKDPPIVTPAKGITVDTIAGSGTAGAADGVGADAQFQNPVGVFIDASGALLVTEYDGNRLRKVPLTGATSTLASGITQPFALLGTEDAIYVQSDTNDEGAKDEESGTIWKVGLNGGTPEVFLTNLGRPRGLARLLDGRVVVSDRLRQTVSILDLGTKELTLLAGSGTAGLRDGHGAEAQFSDPYGVGVLPDGSILVAESNNHVIRKVTLDGDVSVFAGEGVPGMRDHSDKLKARFDGPIDLAVDAAGNVFVSDINNHRIRRISTDGVVETVAGNGERGFADGIGASASFFGQEQLDVTPDGKTIYVSDGNRGDEDSGGQPYHRIRRITIP
jgi:DNA-binding beta-propeller fold protein YncE